jgi:ribosome-associated protein
MLIINHTLQIPDSEIDISAIRAQGAGGQNVNKVASAIHLRFDINTSSLPNIYKQRLLALHDQRITKQGLIIIKAQQYRTQELNKEDALNRLAEIIKSAMRTQKPRKATKPSRSSQRQRLDSKSKHGRNKLLRRKIDPNA